MSNTSPIRYCPIPAYFIPVTVSLQEDAGPRDALEEAVVSLVGIGQRFPHEVVRTLCVASELVESALAQLQLRQIVTLEEESGEYSIATHASAAARPRERPGYVLWDLLTDQPTFQLILGKPHPEPYVPEGLEVLDISAPRPGRRPRLNHIDRAVRTLPEIPDLQVLVPLGCAYRTIDASVVQRVRFLAHRSLLAGRAFVPIEFRPQCEPIVWRPVVVPTFELVTSLDPRGYEGLKSRIPDAIRELERQRMEIDPRLLELLAADGYRSVEELFADAEQRVRWSLVGAWGNPGWQEVQQAAVEAMRQMILSRFLRSSLHNGMHGWADVLERAVRTLLHMVAQPAAYESWRQLCKESQRLRAALEERTRALGALAEQLLKASDLKSGKPEAFHRLIERGTLGSRLLGLIALWVADAAVAQRLRPALEERPDFFRKLDKTIEMRNRTVHPGDEEAPNARALRNAVLELVQAMMKVHAP